MINTKQIANLHKILSCGGRSTPIATIGLTGLLNVSSGTFSINSSSDFTSDFIEVTVPALVNHQLVANEYTYVVVDWNGGNPVYSVITDNNLINHSNVIAAFNVIWENIGAINEGHTFFVGQYGYGLPNKIAHRLIHTQRFGWESGLSLGETGTGYITATSGKVWYDGEEFILNAVNTNVDNFHFYYHSAPNVWTAVKQASYENTTYDDNTGGLKTLTNGRYAVNWIYRSITGQDIFVVLGTGDYKLNEAQSSQPPNVPLNITKQCILIGRIIVLKSAATATQIDSAFTIPFSPSGIQNHNDLNNIQGGAANDYYHLLLSELNALKNELNITQVTLEPRGFENRTDSTLAFNEGTRDFTVTGTYNIWNNGVKYPKTGELYNVPNVTGLYFFYYDANGVFTTSNIAWNLDTDVPIAAIYWNATDAKGILVEERHGIIMDSATHKNLHTTRGTQLVTVGALSGYILSEGTTTVAGQQYGIGATTIADEDLVSALGAFTDGSTYTAIYRAGTGTEWRISSTDKNLPFLSGATPYIAYNQNNAGTWQLTELSTNNSYVNYYLVAVPAIASGYRYLLIPGQATYTTLALAQGETISNLDLSGLPFAEFIFMYRLSYRYNTGASQAATNRGRVEAVASINSNTVTSGITPSVNHNALTGLQGGAVGEYYHLTAAQASGLGSIPSVISGTVNNGVSTDIYSVAWLTVARLRILVSIYVGLKRHIEVLDYTHDGTTLYPAIASSADSSSVLNTVLSLKISGANIVLTCNNTSGLDPVSYYAEITTVPITLTGTWSSVAATNSTWQNIASWNEASVPNGYSTVSIVNGTIYDDSTLTSKRNKVITVGAGGDFRPFGTYAYGVSVISATDMLSGSVISLTGTGRALFRYNATVCGGTLQISGTTCALAFQGNFNGPTFDKLTGAGTCTVYQDNPTSDVASYVFPRFNIIECTDNLTLNVVGAFLGVYTNSALQVTVYKSLIVPSGKTLNLSGANGTQKLFIGPSCIVNISGTLYVGNHQYNDSVEIQCPIKNISGGGVIDCGKGNAVLNTPFYEYNNIGQGASIRCGGLYFTNYIASNSIIDTNLGLKILTPGGFGSTVEGLSPTIFFAYIQAVNDGSGFSDFNLTEGSGLLTVNTKSLIVDASTSLRLTTSASKLANNLLKIESLTVPSTSSIVISGTNITFLRNCSCGGTLQVFNLQAVTVPSGVTLTVKNLTLSYTPQAVGSYTANTLAGFAGTGTVTVTG